MNSSSMRSIGLERRIRVLHLITGLGVGGAENFLLRLALALSEGVETRIASLTHGGGMLVRFREAGLNVVELALSDRNGMLHLPGKASRFAKEVRAWQPQIVQGWLNHGNLAASLVQRVLSRESKLVWSVRQSFDEIAREKAGTRLAIRLQKHLVRLPDAIICNSSRSHGQFIELTGATGRLSVIPNGFDTRRVARSSEFRASARSLMAAGDQELVVAMVARYHPMKDYPCFIEAAGRAARSAPQIRAVCIGSGVTSSDSPIRSLIKTWGLEHRCTLLDEREDLERIYPGIDLLCLTSRWGEGFPNVLGEAMACGVPCIATDVGDASMVVGDAGYVVRPGTPTEVAERIVEYSMLDRNARSQLGERAKLRVRALYSMPVIAGKYMELYREILTAT